MYDTADDSVPTGHEPGDSNQIVLVLLNATSKFSFDTLKKYICHV